MRSVVITSCILVLFLGNLIFFEYLFSLGVKYVVLERLRSKAKGTVALTFDDGPGQRLESKLLEILDGYRARATFFLNAKRAEDYCQELRVLAEAGHELACHTYAHRNCRRIAPWKALADVKKAYRSLAVFVGRKACVRFPYGKFTTSEWLAMKLRGREVVHWTIDSGDTWAELPDMDGIVESVERDEGGVVLMHSFDRDDDPDNREVYVLELTERLLAMAQSKGLRICTCEELMKYRPRTQDYWFMGRMLFK